MKHCCLLALPGALLALWISGASAAAPGAGEFPRLKPGEWEFTRKTAGGPANARDLAVKECLDPVASLREQNAMLAQAGCVFEPVQTDGTSWTYVAQCDIPNVGKTRARSTLVRRSDSAYTVTVESEGESKGKPMKTSETLEARRVGNCAVKRK